MSMHSVYMVRGLLLTLLSALQQVEEGIRASNVQGVLQRSINDLLDLTDLVRGKLNAQVHPTCGLYKHV